MEWLHEVTMKKVYNVKSSKSPKELWSQTEVLRVFFFFFDLIWEFSRLIIYFLWKFEKYNSVALFWFYFQYGVLERV